MNGEKDKTAPLIASPTLDSLPRKKYIDGKELIEQAIDNYSRSTFVRRSALWLNRELHDREKEMESLLGKTFTPQDFSDDAKLIFDKSYEVTNKILEHKSVGAPPSLRKARSLSVAIEAFEKLANERDDLTPEHRAWVEELCGDIHHFVRQIEITYAIVKTDQSGRPKPPNRPPNREGKQFYWRLVKEHRASNGEGTLPKTKFAHEKLADLGIRVTPRAINTWRKQIEDGSFFHFASNKKRK